MGKQEIEVTINLDGTVKGEIMSGGPGGQACIHDLDAILDNLGRKTKEQKKPEFYNAAVIGRTTAKRGRSC